MPDVPSITRNFSRPSYRPEATGMDPDMRRMAIVAVALGGLVALAVGIVSLTHHTRRGVPVIEAMAGPVRVKPLDPGGMKVAGAEDATGGVEALAPAPEKPAIHALHARTHVAARPPVVAEAQPVAAPVIAPAPPAQKAAAQPVPAIVPRGTTVQLAAFDSQQAAEQDWGKMAEKIPTLFNGHRPEVERADLAGHTVYRLRTAGFPTIAAANDFCSKVRARGGNCSIAAF